MQIFNKPANKYAIKHKNVDPLRNCPKSMDPPGFSTASIYGFDIEITSATKNCLETQAG